MGQKNRRQNHRHKSRSTPPRASASEEPTVIYEKKAPVVYGKPFVLLEDAEGKTFIYQSGQWTRHARSIVECQDDCQVKKLDQKINGMTRYEIHEPLTGAD